MSGDTRPVRVRIAPSPTGNCHVGTARGALFNLLFARQHRGALVLRIDDTDQQRSTAASEQGILESLAWLGLYWDEGPDNIGGPYGPYRQSERLDFYRTYAEQLLDTGLAYRCFCTSAELSAEREQALARGRAPRYSGRCSHLTTTGTAARMAGKLPYVVRLRLEPKPMAYVDMVQGRVEQDAALMGDPVIVKSDGMPTYHFATVVDEHEMRISHVIRGVEHLNNTFPQLQICEALDFDPPEFAHIGLLLNRDRSKISKRTGAVFVGEFREAGYLPEAMLNHLALSGWSPGTDKEIFSLDELLETWSLDRCSPCNAVYDRDKLLWMNGVHIRRLPTWELAERVVPFLDSSWLRKPYHGQESDRAPMKFLVGLVHERLKTLEEAADLLSIFFIDPDPAISTNLLTEDRFARRHTLREGLQALAGSLTALQRVSAENWEHEHLAVVLTDQVKALGWRRGELFMVIRIAAAGRQATPSLFETLEGIGRAATLRRLLAILTANGMQPA